MTYSILILDHDQQLEAKILLESIEQCARFDKKVYYLANGSSEDYAYDFYKQGLIDVLIINKENNGCGFGTAQLFQACDTEYAFYIQADQYFHRRVTQEDCESWAKVLEDNPSPDKIQGWEDHKKKGKGGIVNERVMVSHIDLSGDQGHGNYSERGQFIDVAFYNSIPRYGGGPGPFHHLEWTEFSMQEYIRKNYLEMVVVQPLVIGDAGKWAVRQNPDGSRWKHRTDTKELWMLSSPSEKYVYPKFTDEEWDQTLKTKTWPEGGIPEEEKEHSFVHWK